MKPKWVERWVRRLESTFPNAEILCEFDIEWLQFRVAIRYPSYSCGIYLSMSPHPAVYDNRVKVRNAFDRRLTKGLLKMGITP